MEHLNIAEICRESYALGPGKRFILWVQGCPFSCKNCLAKAWIPFVPARIYHCDELAAMVADIPELEGITISGGEPMAQAEGLLNFLTKIKTGLPHLNTIIFTGYKIEQLKRTRQEALLNMTDVLISGLYVEKLNDNKGLRGSGNQRIHYLTDRLSRYKDLFETQERSLEVHIQSNEALLVGVPPKGFSF